MAAPSLVLIKNGGNITAVICRHNLTSCEIKAVFQHPASDDDLGPGLQWLLKESGASGYADAWKGAIVVCLAANQGIFHDFELPPASKRKAIKTVSLLLDGEFPVDPDTFMHKTMFVADESKKTIHSITTIIPKALIATWKNALAACGAASMAICLSPWPLIADMRKLSGPALLIDIAGDAGSISALDQKGRPLGIYQLAPPLSSQERARDIFNQSGMLLDGLVFHPAELLVYGTGLTLKAALEEQFNLPARMLGEDLPVREPLGGLREEDPGRLIAASISRQAFWHRWKMPVFAFKLRETRDQRFFRRILLPVAAALALFVAAGTTFLLDALERTSQSARLRGLMAGQLARTLPDAPKNSSVGRLKAILNSRISNMEGADTGMEGKKVLQLLESIHSHAPADLDVDVRRLALDDKHLRLYGSAGSFDDVNLFKEIMADIDGINESRIVNAANRNERQTGARVEFELDLTRDKL